MYGFLFRYSFFPNISLVIDQIPDYLGFDIDTSYLNDQAEKFFPDMRGKRSIQSDRQSESEERHSVSHNPAEKFAYHSNEECWDEYLSEGVGEYKVIKYPGHIIIYLTNFQKYEYTYFL